MPPTEAAEEEAEAVEAEPIAAMCAELEALQIETGGGRLLVLHGVGDPPEGAGCVLPAFVVMDIGCFG